MFNKSILKKAIQNKFFYVEFVKADKTKRKLNQDRAKKNFQNRKFCSYKKSVKKAGSSNVA